jgi:hypothetical protein
MSLGAAAREATITPMGRESLKRSIATLGDAGNTVVAP